MITAVETIRLKRDGGELTPEAIEAFVSAAVNGNWEDYQLSALLMAIFFQGMTPIEIANYTHAMISSGDRIDLSDIEGPKVDKHSTGGVGDKTSLILAPLAAACGVIVPMMSGRGLGHTGGTLDKLEAISGFRVNLSIDEFKSTLRKTGMGMIGQTDRVAPADKKLYSLRDVTGTVESIPLITASILSKKIAEGISGLVLDVKVGNGAFMKTYAKAQELAQSLVRVATINQLKCRALLTAMEEPLGRTVGNANEVAECIETLKGNGPQDLEELSVILASRMMALAGMAENNCEAEKKIRNALSSGTGLERFQKIIEMQGGDPRIVDDLTLLRSAPYYTSISAKESGFICKMNAELVGIAAMKLGAGRNSAAERIDHSVGIKIIARYGQEVRSGDPIYELNYRDNRSLNEVISLLTKSFDVSDSPPATRPLVFEEIEL